MNKKDLIIAIFLFVLTFLPRLYRIDNPVADWHSWRQADTASITRNFIKQGFTPFYPKFDSYYSLNEYGDQNPDRYFFAEFPIYNILVYPFYKIFGVNEIYSRLVTIFFSSLTSVLLYFLVKIYSSKRVAMLSGFFFAVLPYSIYYGRTIMPDPLHVFFSVLSLFLISLWCENKNEKRAWIYPILSGISTAFILLTKPYGLVLFIPISYLLFSKYKNKIFKTPQIFVYFSLALLPFLLWRFHISHYPQGQFYTAWLFNEGNIRFTGSFFRWLIFDRLNRLIFATGGFVLFWLGIIRNKKTQESLFYYLWLVAVVIFFIIIAKGNVTHDYYQLPILPIGCIFMANGFEFLAMYGKGLFQRIVNFLLAIVLVLLMIAFGWFEVRGYFNVNRWEMVEAGKSVAKYLPEDAKVIAPYNMDSAFLYNLNRYGWTVGGGQIPGFIEKGAQYLVSINFDETTREWMIKCKIIDLKPDRYVIVDLRNCQ